MNISYSNFPMRYLFNMFKGKYKTSVHLRWMPSLNANYKSFLSYFSIILSITKPNLRIFTQKCILFSHGLDKNTAGTQRCNDLVATSVHGISTSCVCWEYCRQRHGAVSLRILYGSEVVAEVQINCRHRLHYQKSNTCTVRIRFC